jgi:hypothetical protein
MAWIRTGRAASPANEPVGGLIARCFDRAGLEALLGEALEAFAGRDPGRLPLSAHVRYTELGQALQIGDGLWATGSGLGGYRHDIVDATAGQAAAFATLRENGHLVLMGLRLRVQLGRISEIETAIYRKGGGPAWADAAVDALDASGGPEALWSEPIPEGRRAPRQALIAVANAYFAGLQGNDGQGDYPITDDCQRLENGIAASNNPEFKIGSPDFNPSALGVKAQLKSGFYAVITGIADRRFPVVDEERGVVASVSVFGHSGVRPEVTLTDGRIIPMPMYNRPFSLLVMDAFRIEDGLIRRVEALGVRAPYGMRTGWPGGVEG